jgi:hypothetical protein
MAVLQTTGVSNSDAPKTTGVSNSDTPRDSTWRRRIAVHSITKTGKEFIINVIELLQ